MLRFPSSGDSPKNRHRQVPRNYLSRREQIRLLLLVFMLGAVVLLMIEAAKPANWQWIWGEKPPRAAGPSDVAPRTNHQPVDTSLPQKADNDTLEVPGSFRAEVSSTDEPGQSTVADDELCPGIDPADLAILRDNTVFRPVESAVWFRWLGVLKQADQEKLDSAAIGRVGFLQLLRQTDAYRGKLVFVGGTVRRAHYLKAHPNDQGIAGYWRCWLFPDDVGDSPIVVYALDMPDRFPKGMRLEEPVEFTGIVYKRWAYQAKGGTMVAPLLLAKAGRWKPTSAADPPGLPGAATLVCLVVLATAAGAFVVMTIYFRGRRTSPTVRRSHTRGPFTALLLAIALGGRMGGPILAEASEGPRQSTIRDLLGVYGIDESSLQSFIDGQPLSVDEHETLYRILFRLPQFALDVVDKNQLRDVTSKQLVEDPERYRGEFIRLAGRAVRVETDSLIAELIDRYQFKDYYRVTCLVDGYEGPVLVCARRVPRVWLQNTAAAREIDERCSLYGMFLKVGPTDGEVPRFVFATDRVAWQPDHVDKRLGTTADHVLLGDLGMDTGLFDEVADRKGLVGSDRECFYQLLFAVEKAPRENGSSVMPVEADVLRMLQAPESLRGRLCRVRGTARRALRIRVDDPDIRSRFGFDHYYELEVFVPLESPVRIVEDAEDRDGKLFNSYPVVVCTRSLPEGMPEGEKILEEVTVSGFYFKLWGYHTQFMTASNGDLTTMKEDAVRPRRKLQISPLLIANQPIWVRVDSRGRYSGVLIGGLFVAVLTAVWLGVLRYRRGDRKFKRSTLDRRFQLEPGHSLDQLRIGRDQDP